MADDNHTKEGAVPIAPSKSSVLQALDIINDFYHADNASVDDKLALTKVRGICNETWHGKTTADDRLFFSKKVVEKVCLKFKCSELAYLDIATHRL